MRAAVLALVAAACAHAREPGLVLEAPARATARVGAARLELWIANAGRSPRRVVLDPDALEVSAASPAGEPARCRPASARDATGRLLAPGERVHLQLDLSTRCDLAAPGPYRVEVRLPGGPGGTVELSLTRWVNPGPLGPARPSP